MVSHPLTNYWDYKPVTVQCPCGIVMPTEDASEHAMTHWANRDDLDSP